MARWTDLADWRGPTVNKRSGGQDQFRGLVVHIAEGYFEGTIAWQKNPDAEVSSHFIVGRDGRIAQMVDTRDAAWTQREGNGEWLSVECVGFTTGHELHRPGWERLTGAQIDAVARLLVRCNLEYGIPLQSTSSSSGRGLGHHSMDDDWGHQSCPGQPIIGQKDDIIRAAHGSPASELHLLAAPEPTLREDDEGYRVEQLQASLNLVGADLDVDGYFGPLTRGELAEFQRRVGIDDDGIYGPVSARELAEAIALEDDMPTADEIAYRTWRYTNEDLTDRDAYAILRGIATEQAAARKRDAAILDAVDGVDSQTILARIDQKAAEDAERDQALLTELRGMASGGATADQIVDALAERIAGTP